MTNPALAYFRFHGRNEEGYIKGRTVAERFDHRYTGPEESQIVERIKEIEKKVERIHAAPNNNRSRFAPDLAANLKKKLNLERDLLK